MVFYARQKKGCAVAEYYFPLSRGAIVTSTFGSRSGGFHWGTDYGRAGGSGGNAVYAPQSGTVIHAGAASGFGGPDPAGWLVIDHPTEAGGGVSVLGHVIREVKVGDRVQAGQRVARVNPSSATNGGVAPHVHLEHHRYVWSPPGPDRFDPHAWLSARGAKWPGATAAPAPAPSTDKGTNMDWWKVEPDVYRLLNKHYTPGRAGRIQYIVRHHNAGVLSINQIWDVWQQRQASAHYQVEVGGRIGQLVNDSDTAWHAANATVNANSIGIEHANSAGAGQDWPISDITIVNGAKLAAALCWFYKLGRPHFGTNIRDHRQYTTTSCPHHLAAGGKYHDRWMQVAQQHYDFMVANPNGAPEQGGFLMALSDAEQRELLAKTRDNHRELNQLYPSRSKYRVDDKPVDTLAGFILNIDGRIHEQFIEELAKNLGKTPEQVAQALSDAVKAAK